MSTADHADTGASALCHECERRVQLADGRFLNHVKSPDAVRQVACPGSGREPEPFTPDEHAAIGRMVATSHESNRDSDASERWTIAGEWDGLPMPVLQCSVSPPPDELWLTHPAGGTRYARSSDIAAARAEGEQAATKRIVQFLEDRAAGHASGGSMASAYLPDELRYVASAIRSGDPYTWEPKGAHESSDR